MIARAEGLKKGEVTKVACGSKGAGAPSAVHILSRLDIYTF